MTSKPAPEAQAETPLIRWCRTCGYGFFGDERLKPPNECPNGHGELWRNPERYHPPASVEPPKDSRSRILESGKDLPNAAKAKCASVTDTTGSASGDAAERAAFEEWAIGEKLPTMPNGTVYVHVESQMAWEAWQARAAMIPPSAERAARAISEQLNCDESLTPEGQAYEVKWMAALIRKEMEAK